jgi:pimeloyl-ACP methyl ester carboxylesterase
MPFLWGQYAAGGMLDATAARAYFSDPTQDHTNLGWVGRAVTWGGGRLADSWPAAPDENAYSRAQTPTVETLIISGELDTTTPPQVAARELLPYLPHGDQVVLPGFGHTGTFFAEQPKPAPG